MTKSPKTLVVIVGPTGSGKTDLGVAVAEHFCAPVISADSRQIFKGMPIGTAQPHASQLARVKHYFVASHDITEPYTSGRYETEALKLLATLFEQHQLVVAVGGSGLYIDALCGGLDAIPKSDPQIRQQLTERLAAEGLESLLNELRELDPEHCAKIDKNNPNRVVRALEVCLQTGRPYSSFRTGLSKERGFNIIKIGTSVDRVELYRRINLRVDKMMEAGLEEEVMALYPYRELNSLQTVGYRELFDYFDGKTTREEAVELIKRNSRRYAKRQMTWFGRDESMEWLDPQDVNYVIKQIEGRVNALKNSLEKQD